MPRSVTVYRVFIGSPGGLDAERKCFRETIDKFNRINARLHDTEFEAVGWEDTLPGKGRPQEKINEDLKLCDFAIFAFHDRWGSPSASDSAKVGTEEEWEIAQHLYSAEGGRQIQDMALYFKTVPEKQLRDPGDHLRQVLAFRNKIFDGKQHLCGSFDEVEHFREKIEEHLAVWLARHVKTPDPGLFAASSSATREEPAVMPIASFTADYAFWIAEADTAQDREQPDLTAALLFAEKALALATTGMQRAEAFHRRSFAEYSLGRLPESLASLELQIAALPDNAEAKLARALYNKGVTLGELGRSEEEIASYDEVHCRFGESDLPALQQVVAKALVNKGVTLGALGRSEEEIASYDEVHRRFDKSDLPALQERVARALYNKGVTLGELGRNEEAIVSYDEVHRAVGESDLPALQEQLAGALYNKGATLGELGRNEEAIASYDELHRRFGESDLPALQEQVAGALINKGVALGELGRSEEEIASYDEVHRRFAESDLPAQQEQVAKALVNKGFRLGALGRNEEEIASYDEVHRRFGGSDLPALQEEVARAIFNKACAFAGCKNVSDCIAALEQWAEKSGSFDCDAVANDSDFNAIRKRPQFVKYLKTKGCSG